MGDQDFLQGVFVVMRHREVFSGEDLVVSNHERILSDETVSAGQPGIPLTLSLCKQGEREKKKGICIRQNDEIVQREKTCTRTTENRMIAMALPTVFIVVRGRSFPDVICKSHAQKNISTLSHSV